MAGDWYYAHGDQRLGPVSLAELRSFLQSGRIQRATLVWTDGMQDWAPASDVKAVSGSEPTENLRVPMGPPAMSPVVAPAAPEPPSPAPMPEMPTTMISSHAPSPSRPSGGADGAPDVYRMLRLAAWPMLAIGLCLAVASKGCDMLAARHSAYLDARTAYLTNYYMQEEAQKRKANEELTKKLRDSETLDATEKAKQIEDLDKKLKADLETLEKEKVRVGQDHNLVLLNFPVGERSWSYYRGALFMLGTAVMILGIVGGFAISEGPDRWGFLVVLAVVVYAIYTSGNWQ